MTNKNKYDRPIQVAEGIYWVGFRDEESNMTCNPYLIVQGDRAVLIDGGSRTDFSVVMMKILQTGINPQNIVGLIYQHYDPDLCGSMPNFIDMIDNPALRIISEKKNNTFISFYISRENFPLLESIQNHGYSLNLNGRILKFYATPYCHSPGSFVTYDKKTQTLFSSDLFGSYASQWDLFLELNETCYSCNDREACPNKVLDCPITDILTFHKDIFPCNRSLRFAMKVIKDIPIDRIAPQHGSILQSKKDISLVIQELELLENVGIDGITG
ncbi:Metallo-beta-lactamase superfamily protein [Desulfocicer vacuolatum DSM 3385]|uniref:Metallo-beta-lactamase superfamily protein n=1 Tax=Desulfocicer vacuolatum DSM 3385 TaxID=1121400 RepID=A0A1W2EM44_9BACT|nr:MBL fold metallo-hydrolase [Desulfocicer vacuolatum]SMD10582.1 Metallo-beta-lactamase superfamily protein [Desulfocicer vacuolatum DSM 3385]